MAENYPDFHAEMVSLVTNLRDKLSGPMSGYGELHAAATRDAALSRKFKELIALGIAIAIQCEGCIVYHVHDALDAGATRDEILETVGVAVMMGGGPAVIYGAQVLEALEQFEAEGVDTR